MSNIIKTSELMNYERNGSNSNNYVSSPISSSPESFPSLMQDGILIEYKEIDYATEILDSEPKREEKVHIETKDSSLG